MCLARAAYHPADIVLLDNPLSAVDQHTALHIFNYCIKGKIGGAWGWLRTGTCLSLRQVYWSAPEQQLPTDVDTCPTLFAPFSHKGLLKDKAVLWITHQLELLPNCTNIAVTEGGHVTYFGPYDADVLNKRLPVDHLLFATVEAGECVGLEKALAFALEMC